MTIQRPDPLAEPAGYGSRLGRIAHLAGPPQAASPEFSDDETYLDDGRCDVQELPNGVYAIQDAMRCAADRAEHWRLACVHEHIVRLDLCGRHVARVSSYPARMTCNGPEGGSCGAVTRIVRRAAVLVDGTLQWWPDEEAQAALPNSPLPPEKLF